jgi:hypothetical protein
MGRFSQRGLVANLNSKRYLPEGRIFQPHISKWQCSKKLDYMSNQYLQHRLVVPENMMSMATLQLEEVLQNLKVVLHQLRITNSNEKSLILQL